MPNKAEFIDMLAERLDGDRKRAAAALDAFIDSVYAAIGRGEKVAISGFGVFERRDRAARVGRNPLTGASVQVPARKTANFRPGTDFKNVANGARTAVSKAAGAVREAADAVRRTPAGKRAEKAATRAVRAASTAAPAKKAAAKKTAAKKAPAKKAAAKKTAAKKAPAKKAAAKKTTAKKTAAKKAAKRA